MKNTDDWKDWQPEWMSHNKGVSTVHDRQERHSPTVLGKKKDVAPRRRVLDSRLWDRMTEPQQDAAIHIADSFCAITRGMGYVAMDPSKILSQRARAGNPLDIQEQDFRAYTEWADRCRRQNIHLASIIDVLCMGFSCAGVDRDMRAKNGFARQHLMAGLDLYCDIRGWK